MEARIQCVKIRFNWTFLDVDIALDYKQRLKFAKGENCVYSQIMKQMKQLNNADENYSL